MDTEVSRFMEEYIVYFTTMREQRENTRAQVTGDYTCGLHLMDNSLDWIWTTNILTVDVVMWSLGLDEDWSAEPEKAADEGTVVPWFLEEDDYVWVEEKDSHAGSAKGRRKKISSGRGLLGQLNKESDVVTSLALYYELLQYTVLSTFVVFVQALAENPTPLRLAMPRIILLPSSLESVISPTGSWHIDLQSPTS